MDQLEEIQSYYEHLVPLANSIENYIDYIYYTQEVVKFHDWLDCILPEIKCDLDRFEAEYFVSMMLEQCNFIVLYKDYYKKHLN